MTIRVFLVEDHRMVREMLKTYLEDLPDVSVCGIAATGEEAVERIVASNADVALIDVSLPGISGIEVLKVVRALCPEIRCVMHSGHGESTYVDQALNAGAAGYVLKGRPAELPQAIRSALRDETYLSLALHDQRRIGQPRSGGTRPRTARGSRGNPPAGAGSAVRGVPS